MKIAMVSEHASPLAPLGGPDAGGQNVHVAELSSALAAVGHDVVVYTRADTADVHRRVEVRRGYGVQHIPAGPPGTLARDELLPHMGEFAEHLRRHWSADPPDIAHAHFWMSGLATLDAAAELPSISVAQTFHALGAVKRRYQGAEDTSPPCRIETEKRIAAQVDRVLATCSDEVFELVRLGAPRTRISIVPSGVDVYAMHPGAVPGYRSARHRIVALGRLVPRKGVDDVIRALVALPDTELVIAGGPAIAELGGDPDARRLADLARDCGVADRVRLVGGIGRDTVASLLTSADAMVCVPWYEPFGIVPLEAMACGVPVVASAVGGLSDTVVDGVTGLHVRPRDPDELAAALADLLADESRIVAMGVAGRSRAVARYSWPRVAADTARVYQRLRDRAPLGSRRRASVAGGGR